MVSRISSCLGVLVFLSAGLASAQTVDELVARNLEARGGKARLEAIQTLRMSGRFSSQGIELPTALYAKRPNLTRRELSVGDRKVLFVFDGTSAWQLNPLQGDDEPVAITGPELEVIRQESDFDSPLLDYETRGYTVEFVGAETIDGRALHHLRVARNGQTQDCYLDAATGLEAMTVNHTPMGELAQEFLDYREVQGVKMPFAVRTLQNGIRVAEITFDEIVLDASLDAGLFQKPGR